MVQEKDLNPISGNVFSVLGADALIVATYFGSATQNPLGVLSAIITVFIISGLFIMPDEQKKATMVYNLMQVLCGDNDATPVINPKALNG